MSPVKSLICGYFLLAFCRRRNINRIADKDRIKYGIRCRNMWKPAVVDAIELRLYVSVWGSPPTSSNIWVTCKRWEGRQNMLIWILSRKNASMLLEQRSLFTKSSSLQITSFEPRANRKPASVQLILNSAAFVSLTSLVLKSVIWIWTLLGDEVVDFYCILGIPKCFISFAIFNPSLFSF